MSKVTKKDIVDFANAHYQNNYVVVNKLTGTKEAVHKIDKPHITPIQINRDVQSEFLKNIVSREVEPIEPVFLDFEKDITKFKTKSGLEVFYNKNEESPTFALYYIFEMGSNHNPKINIAIDYLNYLGTSKKSAAELKMDFFRTGCNFRVSSSNDQIYISLSGLSENFEKGLALLEHLISDAKPNPDALKNMIEDVIKKRENNKLSKNVILWGAMYNYGVYGKGNPFTNILSENELRNLKAEELTALIKGLNTYKHKVVYYGTHTTTELENTLMKYHKVPKQLKDIPNEKEFTELPNLETKIYVVNYEMKQVDIIMLSKSEMYNPEIAPYVNVFNEYFGSGMSSVVFQELREAKGLAYTAYANFRTPSRPDNSHYIMTFIGTQNDKLPEATAGMYNLLNNMPESEKHFENAKEAITEKIRTERITKASILFSYLRAEKMGLNYDIRKNIYNSLPSMEFSKLKNFQEVFIKDKNFTILVLGKKEDINVSELEKYGEVVFLELEDIFGY